MNDTQCIRFLQWALPRLQLRWEGFRKVRNQVCKRILRRIRELELPGFNPYREYLASRPEEWEVFDSFCRITISRFYRDQGVFRFLQNLVLPELSRLAKKEKRSVLRCLSIGCASGEEPYTVALIWRFGRPPRISSLSLKIIGMEAGREMLIRARKAGYLSSSLKDLPVPFRAMGFYKKGNLYFLKREVKDTVLLIRQDVRVDIPKGPFDLVFCRNVVFTYFEEGLQREILEKLHKRLIPNGVLVIGSQERLPEDSKGFIPWSGPCIFIRTN